MKIYFDKPQDKWEDSLVFGNGHLGGMSKGTIAHEMINLNDDRFWSGTSNRPQQTYTKNYLSEIRELIKNRAFKEAEALIEKHMLGYFTESYLVLGFLSYIQDIQQEVEDFSHTLNLEEATIQTCFTHEGVNYERNYFASYPDKTMYFEFKQTQLDKAASVTFETPFRSSTKTKDHKLYIEVEAPTHVVPDYINDPNPVRYEGETEKYHYVFELLRTDGDWFITDNGFELCNFTIVQFAFRRLEDIDINPFEEALELHINDYQNLYKRVAMQLGPEVELPIDQRVERLRNGEKDDQLIALYFQFGRYLMISSSRPGTLAANLQGIWNWEIRPRWSSNYTTNINVQMNYWGADLVNLSECSEPYVDLVKLLTESGKKTAQDLYDIEGTVIHHNADKWGNTAPVGRQYGADSGDEGATTWAYWPMAGLWMAADLYRHYEFIEDEEYLRDTVFPVLLENVKFINGFVVEIDGVYHTIPSTSPENQYYDDEGNAVSIAVSSTMDLTLINEVIGLFEQAMDILKIEDEESIAVLNKSLNIKDNLASIQIGEDGSILEYQEAFKEVEAGHRHFSHLYGIYPSNYLDVSYYPAAKKAVEKRMQSGGGHTGWSNGWLINLHVKLGEYEKAYEHIIHAITKASSKSLLSLHPPYQIDGNFGVMTGIANLLVESEWMTFNNNDFEARNVSGLKIKR
ncbi:glycosyl hydrolase family 95 catalytic domain-containing protein [Fundicoccus sp. Sow4_H7]|uniref:glycosyl hydrolase family 95 catalytic domain-containing protein n=1 Tax=Fundicoccus sp. Sow4_H7 TaxID=3438784 RepID=UPI003F8DCD83